MKPICLATICLLLAPNSAFSETCKNPDVLEMYESSTQVFIGNIKARKNTKPYRLVLDWEIEQSFKGKNQGIVRASFIDESASPKLKGLFRIGKRYLVFLNGGNEPLLTMNWCAGGAFPEEHMTATLSLVKKAMFSAGKTASELEALVASAVKISKSGKHQEAIKKLESFTATGKTETRRLFYLSLARAKTLSYQDAIRLNQEVIGRDPYFWEAYYNNACLFALSGNIEKTIELLQQLETTLLAAAISDVDKTNISQRFARLFDSDQDLAKARKKENFKEIADRFKIYSLPQTATQSSRLEKMKLARLAFKKNDFSSVKRELSTISFALVDRSVEAERLMLLAHASSSTGDYQNAIKMNEQAIFFKETSFRAYAENALYLLRAKDRRKALEYITRLSRAIVECFDCVNSGGQGAIVEEYIAILEGQDFKPLREEPEFQDALSDLKDNDFLPR